VNAGKGALIFGSVIAALAGIGGYLFWRGNHPFGYTEQIPGGAAAGHTPLDFDPVQLHQGVEVEMEHTDDWRVAQEIAMDHLTEDPDYYAKLAQIDPHHFY
jgi:hypothetical protein